MDPPAEETCNWLELPQDVMSTIFKKVGVIDTLANAQLVCTTWRRICKDPTMWRVIDLENFGNVDIDDLEYDPEKIAKYAVDLSSGQLVAISIHTFCTDELLDYIADRSSQLRCLRLVRCYECSIPSSTLKKLPLLEELHLYYTAISKDSIVTVGQFCPNLKSFKLTTEWFIDPYTEFNDVAVTIAENIPQLHHLQLFANQMTNSGLQSILNSCLSLELLDVRQCFNITDKNLLARCTGQIKDFRGPHDSTEDYEFDAEIRDNDLSEVYDFDEAESGESWDEDSFGFGDIWSDGFYDDADLYELDYDDYTLLYDDYTELLDF